MKKNYFMLAAATMMFAACAETDLVNEINEAEAQYAISFETFTNKATRAAENSTASYNWALNAHHLSFDVWGYKDLSDEFVFTDEPVTYTSSWGYTGLVYWDKAAGSYEFYAAAPSSSIWTLNKKTEAKNDDYFTVSNYVVKPNNAAKADNHGYAESFKEVTNAEDLMIAAPKTVAKGSFGQTVQLEFNHILSRLNVTVSKDATLGSQTVVMKSLNFYNINHHGSFNESTVPTAPATLASGTNERWVTTDYITTYTALTNEELQVAPASPAVPEYMLQSLVMPQLAGVQTVNLDGTSTGLTEPYFTIVYTITDNGNTEEFSASYNLATAFGFTGDAKLAFNEGWQNTLNINIKPAAISFTGSVAEWADKTKGTEDIE